MIYQIQSPPAREVWVEMAAASASSSAPVSPPAREVWVEIQKMIYLYKHNLVASREGGVG